MKVIFVHPFQGSDSGFSLGAFVGFSKTESMFIIGFGPFTLSLQW